MWEPNSVLTLDTNTKKWTKTRFEAFHQWRVFVTHQWKMPGEYNFKNTEQWIEAGLKFQRDKRYCDYHPNSKEYKEFWALERRKCEQGIIVDKVYISPDDYFFWNYCMIPNKIEQKETLPEIWDGHYHYDLYCQLAELYGEDVAGTKSRQKGISLYHVARLTRRLWFGTKYALKIASQEEEYVLGEWSIMQGYRNHLNEHTGWYRHFQPDESLFWEQKQEITEGVVDRKKIYKGNKCKIKGLTTKMNVTKAVGGAAKEIYITEAGINSKLKKIKEYVDPNLKMGNVKTGLFLAMGAVGELKDAADLQDFCFNPRSYNIRAVKDTFGNKEEDIAFFFPEEWNYIHQDEETGEIIKCYDKDGNSNIELAVGLIQKEIERQKRLKDEQGFKLWLSQHPRNLQDAFDQREDNPFPTHLLKEKEQELLTKKFNIVSFFRDESNKPKHKFSNDVPVTKLKPNPNEDNRGATIIKELPIDKPPFGLYYAGVDPIYNVDTSTSKSLMSIAIWIGYHEKNGKFCEPYPVAWYTGRHKKTHDTYQICLDLIEFYNARAVVENNVKDFIEWMIRQGKSKYAMRRRELTVIGEMMPESTIRDEIGVRMETEFKKRAVEKMIHWLETPYSVEFDMETGEGKDLYNVSKLGDIMFIRELLRYNPKLNTDRLVANLLCLIGLQSDSNRHIINEVDYTPKEKPKNLSKGFPSPFLKNPQTQIKYLPSPFGTKK